jgi:hypothetical protein
VGQQTTYRFNVVADFSDSELKELELVAHEEFEKRSDAGWTVIEVRRGLKPGLAELIIESTDHRQMVVLVDRSEYEEENPANGSRLSDVGFNFSIRLLEYNAIRGFEEFSGKTLADLEPYPADRPAPPPPPEDTTRSLRSPFSE